MSKAENSMHSDKSAQRLHRAFLLVVILKGLNGVLEIVLGALLAVSNVVLPFILNLAANELIEDPNDFLATHITAISYPSPSTLLFAALYLLAHGVVKIVLAFGLWFNKIWAYPAAIAIIGLLIVYQFIRILEKGSIILAVFTIIDCIFVWLIYREYRQAIAG